MSERFRITFSSFLYEAAEILRARRGYRSQSEYLAGLVRYDGQSQKDHLLTAGWAALTGYERDKLDEAILNQVKSEKGVLGSWLEARIDAAVKKYYDAGKPAPTAKEIAKELGREIIKENT